MVRSLTALAAAAALLLASTTARAAVVTVRADGVILVDGEPFLPIMQWAQCAWRIPDQAALGINTFVGSGCSDDSDAEFLDACAAAGVFGAVAPSDLGLASHEALLGWIFGDEPDLERNQVEPETLAEQHAEILATDPSHVTLLTVTAGFWSGVDPPAWMGGSRDRYHAYADATDVIGFDLYPVYGFCQPDWIASVGEAQEELVSIYAPDRATYQWIEASDESSQWCELCDRCADPGPSCSRDAPCEGDGPLPEEVRNEVFQALIHGATAIGYFTHAWECPGYTQFCVGEALAAELTRTNAQLSALAPAILSEPYPGVAATIAAGGTIDLAARLHEGRIYVLAASLEHDAVTATLAVPGMTPSAAVEVHDEARTLTPAAETFDDAFAPLEVHVYIVDHEPPTDGDADADTDVDADADADADADVDADVDADADADADDDGADDDADDGCSCAAPGRRPDAPLASTLTRALAGSMSGLRSPGL